MLVDSHPTAFQVPFPPCSASSTRRKPSLQTRPPKPPGNSPRVCAYGANVAAICLIGGKTCRALFSFSRPAPCGLAQACPPWGRCAPRFGFAGFTPRATVTPSRCSIGMSCRLPCATFTGCGRNMPAIAGRKWGACESATVPLPSVTRCKVSGRSILENILTK